MGRGDTGDGDLPVVEVFSQDDRQMHPPSKEPTAGVTSVPGGRARGRIVVAMLVVGMSLVVVGLVSSADGPGAAPVDVAETGAREAVPGDPFAGEPVLDGAQRSTIAVAGETCCDRPAAIARVSDVFARRAPSLAADIAGVPGAAVFTGPDGAQLVALDAGEVTVVVAAEASRPFTPAELATLRDHVSAVVDGNGAARLVVAAPLVARAVDGSTATSQAPLSAGSTASVRTDQTTFVAGGADSGTVVAVDRWTGRVLWATTVGSAAFLDGVVDGIVVVATGPGRVVALDVFTGAPR